MYINITIDTKSQIERVFELPGKNKPLCKFSNFKMGERTYREKNYWYFDA